jgi:hypothetical protein
MDWLKDVPVYHNLNEIAEKMSKAVEHTDEDPLDHQMSDCDAVLAGLVCYLAEHYTINPIREAILEIVDTYCGKPTGWKDDE